MESSLMAGLAGVLLAPQYPTLQFNNYAILLVAALANGRPGPMRPPEHWPPGHGPSGRE